MPSFLVEPEVAGELGDRTVMDSSVHPPVVSHLHYVLDGWLGSQLLESFPCFIATDNFVATVRAAGLTGFEIDEADVELSPDATELLGDTVVPHFNWFKVVGSIGDNDFALQDGLTLVVSDRGLSVIEALLADAVIEPLETV